VKELRNSNGGSKHAKREAHCVILRTVSVLCHSGGVNEHTL
jgi:hypothetical protein